MPIKIDVSVSIGSDGESFPIHSGAHLLLEDGFHLLLEDGGRLILEP